MVGAGFSADAAPRLWRMMGNMGGGNSGFWLDSHPSHAERERSLQLAATNLQPAYSQASAGMASVQVSSIDLSYVHDPWPTSPFKTYALTAEERAASALGNYRKGVEAFRSGQFEVAIEAFKASADEDLDERAMARLYGIYVTDRYVPKDENRAREYAERSAAKGFAPGIYALGDAALRKLGAAPFDQEASELFTLAHQRGFPTATYRLALLYVTGQGGVSRDPLKARQLAQLSAERNDAQGKSLYGAFLRDGIGGPADPTRGFQFIKEAVKAAPSNGFAQLQLGIAHEKGMGTPSNRQAALDAYRMSSAVGNQQAKDRLKTLTGE
jgi:TPR repeat protein